MSCGSIRVAYPLVKGARIKRYTQLTQEQRYQISGLKRAGFSQNDMALELGVHKSTICREFKRNTGQRGYRPKQAQELASGRQQERAGRCRILASTWDLANALLRQEWSPEQVSASLWQSHRLRVSHERIYQHIYADKRLGGTLHQHLRCQKKRRKRYGGRDRRGCIPMRRSIDDRPKIVDSRIRIGDWEVDTIVGKGHQQALVSLVERKSRLMLLQKVERATADAVADAVINMLTPFSDHVRTITSDNGREFADHERIAKELDVDFYFAHPYSSWERGSNENTNGLVRQYFPKDQPFTTITNDEVDLVIQKLNNRPRKILKYRTPQKVYSEKTTVALLN